MKHHKIMVTGLALTLAVGLLAACDSAKEQEITAETAHFSILETGEVNTLITHLLILDKLRVRHM